LNVVNGNEIDVDFQNEYNIKIKMTAFIKLIKTKTKMNFKTKISMMLGGWGGNRGPGGK